MATSQNGWPGITKANLLEPMPHITGRMLPDDVFTIFHHLNERFHAEVEPIRKEWSWGWNYRFIGGTEVLSNHGSATAEDLNAPAHPQLKLDTFKPAQIETIENILDFFDGVLRWGGHYSEKYRDDMHFEIDVKPGDPRIAKVVAKINALDKPTPSPVPPAAMSLSDEDVARIAQAIASFPIHYSSGAVGALQDSVNHHYLSKAVARDTRQVLAEVSTIRKGMRAVVREEVLAALATAPIVTTTTIGGKK